ncbi:MAG TPA: STAS domain-containing protein [Rhodocyclaceae bacterium]|nr:STAS domain-containing protein [Rhodocyclaceae bacterium]
MSFRIVDSRGGAMQALLDGELSIYTVAALKGDIEALGPGPIDIDLSGVTDVDTAGLQWMLMAKRLAGRSVRFVHHSAAVLQMLDHANLAGPLGDPLVLPHDPLER